MKRAKPQQHVPQQLHIPSGEMIEATNPSPKLKVSKHHKELAARNLPAIIALLRSKRNGGG